jgi:ATP-dependent Clp protease ATP-binding subunit ClpB
LFVQEAALNGLSETLYTSLAGLKDESRPLGSLLLKGPNGVGKTKTVRRSVSFYLMKLKKRIETFQTFFFKF